MKNGALQTFGVEAAIVTGLFFLIVPILQIKGPALRVSAVEQLFQYRKQLMFPIETFLSVKAYDSRGVTFSAHVSTIRMAPYGVKCFGLDVR